MYDYDNDGVIDKTIYVDRYRVSREDIDSDRDGRIDKVLHFDYFSRPFMNEYDLNQDGLLDYKELFLPNHCVKKKKDTDYDGLMDCAWFEYCDSGGRVLRMDLDHNNDDIVDSRINVKTKERFDLIHGRWHRSYSKDKKNYIDIRGKLLEIVFKDGEWLIKEPFSLLVS